MLEITVDATQFIHLEKVFRKLGNQAPHAIRRAVNHTGDKAATQVKRALVKQTGATYRAVGQVLSITRASIEGDLVYRIIARDKHIPLKAFGARPTSKGVSAAPWNTRRIFPKTFIVAKLGGQVFVRRQKHRPYRIPVLKKLWGPAIPKELVRGETAAVFQATVAAELPRRVEHEINAIISGAAPRG